MPHQWPLEWSGGSRDRPDTATSYQHDEGWHRGTHESRSGSPCRIVRVRSEKWLYRSAWATVTGFRYLTINLDDKDKILDMLNQTHNKEQLQRYPNLFG
jgi:hypothetical protein